MKKQTVSKMIDELNEIHKQITKDNDNVPKKVKKRFWKIVGQIKRTSNPDRKLVTKASKIRDLLYSQKYGGSIPLWLALPFLLFLGVICLYGFIYAVLNDVWGGIGGYRHFTIWWTMCFLYPFGRFIAGKFTGIKFDGYAIGSLIFPTLKINYPSYLTTSPPKRKWFFFFSGAWTTIVMGIMGIFGYLILRDTILLVPFVFTTIAYIPSAMGFLGKYGGEMWNFHRERKIVRDWRRIMASDDK